jgi:predicted glycoside hydrolase/deacetylase ChbG (UPF0249 family)
VTGSEPPPATLAIVADDFARAPGIDEAILALARRGRLQSGSCLVNQPRWRAAAPALADTPSGFGVGLHFNLTDGEPLSADLRRHWPRLPGLGRVLALGLLRALPRAAIAAEWRAQLDAFVTARAGRLPDHVDGHQHVHHLPGVRETLLDSLEGLSPRPAVRNTGRLAGPGSALKQRVIEHTGGTALQRELQRRGWPHRAVLLGAYGFEPHARYRDLMRGWLAEAPRHRDALLFCHPATNAERGDPIGAARVREYAYLASETFPADLSAARVMLG